MEKKWALSLLVILLVFSLAACTSTEPELTPTIAPTAEPDSQENASSDGADEKSVSQEIDAASIFASSCAKCHGGDRSGNNGPPLLPGTLTKGAEVYNQTITNGSGPMPAFGSRLSSEEIDAVVGFILSEVE